MADKLTTSVDKNLDEGLSTQQTLKVNRPKRNRQGELSTIYQGAIIYSTAPTTLVTIENGLLGVSDEGKILFVDEKHENIQQHIKEHQVGEGNKQVKIHKLKKTQLLIPGFIDTHIHAPQYVFTGTGYDKPLLEWLNTYTFPRESEFKSKEYALNSYKKVVKRSLYCGTTTACYFGTIHLESCKVLANMVHECGQRAYVGKVNMDRHSPDYYIEKTEGSQKDTELFVEYVMRELKSPLVTAVITPRFVPTCTPELMQFLGDLARKHNLPIQSHISENKSEIEWVRSLHPECQSYSHVYEKYGLLNDRTIMAHCIYLSEQERKLFKELQVGIAHCPNSNFSLQSGVCHVRQLFLEGIDKIGLGTDVGGGYSPCILDSIRQAATASKLTCFLQPNNKVTDTKDPTHDDHHEENEKKTNLPLSLSELFYLATLGGAKCLNLDKQIGSFEPGKDFDALLISVELDDLVDEGRKNIHLFPHDQLISRFEKFLYLGDDRNIESVFVAGKRVK